MLFVDFKQHSTWWIEKKTVECNVPIGIPEKLTRIGNQCTYKGTRYKASFGETYSNEFPVSAGFRQGDALFNIALESLE